MNTKSKSAFTFLELILVVAVFVVVLTLVALPSLARSKTRSPAAGCLSNLRQLMTGWQMYADDNRGRFMLNSPIGFSSGTWCPTVCDWNFQAGNTNVNLLLSGSMGKYVNSNATVFRCPGDVVPSQNGYRVRSYSMNSQMAPYNSSYSYGGFQNYSGRYTYSKESDIKSPYPGNLFVFCDEHPASMEDSYFQVPTVGSAKFPNIPASYLEGGCGFSFADGHAEIHHWQSTLLIPVRAGVTMNNVGTTGTDPDLLWLVARCGSTNGL